MAGENGEQSRIMLQIITIAYSIIGAVLEFIGYFISPPEPIEAPFHSPVAYNSNNHIGWSPDVGPVIRSLAEKSSSRYEDDLVGVALLFNED